MALNLITLPPELVSKSWEYGKSVVAGYEAGHNANSRAVTCFDAHSNVELQALSRMAECAFCLWANISPERLDWSSHCDDGHDVLWGQERIDIKHTKKGSCLIWPIGKNSIFENKKFDRLVLITGNPSHGFEISGWVTKHQFKLNHRVAPAGHRLVHGTWFMDKSELQPMETFWVTKQHPTWESMWARKFDYPERI